MSATTARFPLPRKGRRALLVAHVAVSVSWLGLTLGILVLGLTGRFSGSEATSRAAYLALDVFGDWLLLPVALTTLLTGVWLGIGTHWGLLRHYWVAVKLVVTIGAAAATALLLRSQIATAASAVASGAAPEADTANALIGAPCVSLSLYLFMTAVSVLKPWGPTARGRRLRAQSTQRRLERTQQSATREAPAQVSR